MAEGIGTDGAAGGGALAQIHRNCRAAAAVIERINPITAINDIIARAANDDVIRGGAGQFVSESAADQVFDVAEGIGTDGAAGGGSQSQVDGHG